MNKERRQQIDAIIKRLETELAPLIEDIKSDMENVRDDEQEYYDNMPESFQSGDKGERAQTAIDALENAISDLDDSDLSGIIGYLNEAQE